MTHLDLFSGIGGFALAAKWAGFRTVAFCEIEEYPRKVLRKNFPGVPIHLDVRDINGEDYKETSLITGGYPCQPFSLAGKRKGKEDNRHLWPEMLRIIKQARPPWVVAENVTGHVSMGLDQVLFDLESEGYASRPFIIPACAVDAPHRRDRVWIIANSGGYEEQWKSVEKLPEDVSNTYGIDDDGSRHGASAICRERSRQAELCGSEESVSNTYGQGLEERESQPGDNGEKQPSTFGTNRWPAEPGICRIFNELPEGLDESGLSKSKKHDIMGNNNKEDYHAATKKARSREILPSLQQTTAQEEVQRQAGGLDGISEKEILRSAMQRSSNNEGQSDTCDFEKKSNFTEGELLRVMWDKGKFEYSSHGPKSCEQRSIKSDDVVRFLSYIMALDAREAQEFSGEAATTLLRMRESMREIKVGYVPETLSEIQEIWRSSSNEEKEWFIIRVSTGNAFCRERPNTPRVATGIPCRVNRLKGLGNAIVPQVAYQILKQIRECSYEPLFGNPHKKETPEREDGLAR